MACWKHPRGEDICDLLGFPGTSLATSTNHFYPRIIFYVSAMEMEESKKLMGKVIKWKKKEYIREELMGKGWEYWSHLMDFIYYDIWYFPQKISWTGFIHQFFTSHWNFLKTSRLTLPRVCGFRAQDAVSEQTQLWIQTLAHVDFS